MLAGKRTDQATSDQLVDDGKSPIAIHNIAEGKGRHDDLPKHEPLRRQGIKLWVDDGVDGAGSLRDQVEILPGV